MSFDFLIAILCGHFSIGVSLNSPSFKTDEFVNFISSIIHEHFPDECVCFFKDSNYSSSMFDKMIKDVAKVKLVSLVSPIEDRIPIDMRRKEPQKPYPCGYVVHIPHAGSTIPWSLLRGYYYPTGIHDYNSRYLLVAEEFHSDEEIEQVLMEMFSYGFIIVDFLNLENSRVNAYTLFPFGRDFKSCPEESPVTERIATWNDGELKQFLPMFPRKLPDGEFNGCLWNISSPYFTPYVLSEHAGQFTGPMEGYDAGPLSLLTQRLNLTPRWNIDLRNLWSKTLENGTIAGSIPDLVLGRGAQMSCGGLGLHWADGNAHSTMFHTWSSVKWFVAAPNKVPKWQMLVYALNESIWPFILACTIIVPPIYWGFCILCKQPKPFSQILLSFTALMFGNFTTPPPVIWTLRLVFLAWLLYALHIDQFYLASLTGLITSAGYEPMIKTIDQLINSNLPTMGYIYVRAHLEKTHKESVQKLLRKFIKTDRTMNITLPELSQFKNFSVADNEIFIKHVLSTLTDVYIYPTSVANDEFTISSLMLRHNYLFERINWIFIRMYDAGFPVYFLKKFIPPNQFWSDPKDATARALTLEDLGGPFYVLIVGLSVSSVAFVCEVLFYRLYGGTKPKERKINRFRHEL